MTSMSYCLFENTLSEFRRCLRAAQKARESGDTLSSTEFRSARELHALALKLVTEFPPEDGGLDFMRDEHDGEDA